VTAAPCDVETTLAAPKPVGREPEGIKGKLPDPWVVVVIPVIGHAEISWIYST
jgi:hypothetical protein